MPVEGAQALGKPFEVAARMIGQGLGDIGLKHLGIADAKEEVADLGVLGHGGKQGVEGGAFRCVEAEFSGGLAGDGDVDGVAADAQRRLVEERHQRGIG
ncbi:hypothetical protein FKK50_26780, partial [Klebsiella pneumoniae]|nr:hypothetical protein [Klebsiella pneumoniae]